MIKVTLKENKNLLLEEMSKTEIRDLIQKEVEKELKRMLRDSDTKEEIAQIAKSLLKKLYKELSIQQTYVIDNIKV